MRESTVAYFKRMAPIWRAAGVTEIYATPAAAAELMSAVSRGDLRGSAPGTPLVPVRPPPTRHSG
jgi:hypothetical protein